MSKRIPKDMIAGTRHMTNSCGELEIVEYVSFAKIKYRFIKTGYTDQQAFIAACKAKTEMDLQVTWTDGTIGTFTFQPFGFQINETSPEEWIMFTVNGKQNSDTVWTTAS